MGVKIFQIGFNKCATSTLFRYFERNGVPAIHWDQGDIARRFQARQPHGEDPFSHYQDIVFFSDMSVVTWNTVFDAYKHFEYIHKFYPDALFILNTRDKEDWIESRKNHPNLHNRYEEAFGLRGIEEVVDYWRREWDQHHARVLEFFRDKPGRLLVFDIDRDGPAELASFVSPHYALDTDPALYVPVNVTAPRLQRKAKLLEARAFLKRQRKLQKENPQEAMTPEQGLQLQEAAALVQRRWHGRKVKRILVEQRSAERVAEGLSAPQVRPSAAGRPSADLLTDPSAGVGARPGKGEKAGVVEDSYAELQRRRAERRRRRVLSRGGLKALLARLEGLIGSLRKPG